MNLPLFLARRMARPSPENRPGVMERIAVVSVALGIAVMILALAVILGFKREVSSAWRASPPTLRLRICGASGRSMPNPSCGVRTSRS